MFFADIMVPLSWALDLLETSVTLPALVILTDGCVANERCLLV
jgi:hypothetical protein